MKLDDHNRLIKHAARSELKPIGCVQKGQSRTWLDDQNWWVGVVEFQPHSGAKGSYLNVGACWLWHEKDYLSFDDGHRVEPFNECLDSQKFGERPHSLWPRGRRTKCLIFDSNILQFMLARSIYVLRQKRMIGWFSIVRLQPDYRAT